MIELITGTSLAAAAGLNAYIPLLVVGLLARYSELVRLPAEFGWISDWRALAVLGVLLAAEVVLDKVAIVDSVNDAVQTFVRPAAGGAVFAATDAAARLDSSWHDSVTAEHPWLGWALGVGVALAVHVVKATVRPVIDAGTLGTGTPVVSAAEDTASLGMSLLAVLAPVVALLALLIFGYAGFRLVRTARRRRRDKRAQRAQRAGGPRAATADVRGPRDRPGGRLRKRRGPDGA